MPAISLDDIGSSAQARPKKKTSKATVKAATSIKKAKSVKVVSKGIRAKKKKKRDPALDLMPTLIDADSMYSEIAAATAKKQAEDEAPKKKKKKKKENAVDTIKKAKKKRDKPAKTTDLAALEGQLMEVLDDIPDVIKQENEQLQEYITMFTKCQSIARICEKQYEVSKQSKDIYALMQLYNQMREIIADLRALRDVNQLGEILNSEVLGPFAESAGTILISVFHAITAWNKNNLDVDSIANAHAATQQIIRSAAKDIEQAYQAGLDKTVGIFSASA
ncbi:hypothetical protein HOS33_gp180 [Erwinia phage vB_EamM_Y3]|uniref:Uncharacterized protein n=1 Tax=Erwinia phage vB_EamM_Y3 TaxID=1983553 RepID=A0A2H4IBF1_9CAUD|nr:hypothetical protein HOS33_gp180 [Erwinia phage vB_EamM_Y3]ARW58820.1 hypothetical protein Y3_180 [Erwinia phage vB_EamM_Y3]